MQEREIINEYIFFPHFFFFFFFLWLQNPIARRRVFGVLGSRIDAKCGALSFVRGATVWRRVRLPLLLRVLAARGGRPRDCDETRLEKIAG